MRVCRFDGDRLGVVVGSEVVDVSEALEHLPAVRWPFPPGDALIANWQSVSGAVADAAKRGPRKPVDTARLQSPVGNPNKIIGIARNRKDLASEKLDAAIVGQNRKDGDPCHMFIKANNALAGASDGVALRFSDRRTDPEIELAIVVGKAGTDISRERAMDHVFGFTIGMDMSMRGVEPPSSRKSIDSYALVGPWIVTRDEIPDPDRLKSSLHINGDLVQETSTADLAFDVRAIVAHCSTFFTLYPGDVIMAGSPAQFRQVVPGDRMVAEFEGIGRMTIPVHAHEAAVLAKV